MPTILPPKKDVALALLERASVFIHLDPRDPSVQVPSWFKRQPQLVLQVGLNMLVRIPDLDVGDEAIACTLSFNRAPHYCYVPWKAVYALVGEDGRGMVWPEDIPPEVPAQASNMGPPASARPRLHSVPRDSAAPGSASAGSVPPGFVAAPASESIAAKQGPSSREPASKKPASAGASRRMKFRVAGQLDSDAASSARGPSLFPPPMESAAPSQGNARGASASKPEGESKQDGLPVLALSGSKRRRANAERKAADSRVPPASSRAGAAGPEVAGPVSPLLPSPPAEPAAQRDSSTSSDSLAPLSSSDSQERNTRSSERPYLRLVR